MPGAEHGFLRALMAMITGAIVSILVQSLALAFLGEAGKIAVTFITAVFVVILALAQLGKVNYWSLTYLLGYFSALILLGTYLMEYWEFVLYLILFGIILVLKIARKLGLDL